MESCKFPHNIRIFFLKHIRIDAIVGLSCCVILFIFGNLINKEQTQHLNAFMEQLAPRSMWERMVSRI